MDQDLNSQTKPWALSPLISSMPHLHHTRGTPPPFPATDQNSLSDDVTQLHLARQSRAPSRVSSNASIASLTAVKAKDHDAGGKSSRENVAEVKARFKNGASMLKDKMNGDASSKDGNETDGSEAEGVAEVEEIPKQDAGSRRAYFADAGRRKEIVFGPEVCIFAASYPALADLSVTGYNHRRLLPRLSFVYAFCYAEPAWRHLVRPVTLLGRTAGALHML